MRHFFLIAFAISVLVVCFGEAGLLSAYRTSQEKALLETRVRRLERENEQLTEQVNKLKNPQFLEYTVRQSLSLVAGDELVFEFQ